jgi:hypothetical protein
VNWTNATLYGISGNNAEIYNYGVWNAQSDDTFTGGYNGGTTLFDNFGTFLKSGHTGSSSLDGNVVFNNSATVSVQGGTLNIGRGTSSGSGFTTANGETINLSNYTFTNVTTFTGSGSYVAGGATFAGTIAGTLNWDGGILNGVLTVASNSFFNIGFGGGQGIFRGLTLTNYGTVNWTNTALYGVNDQNAQIYNYGVWNAQSDDTFVGGYNGGTSLFDNFGTFLKSGHSGATVLDGQVVFNNTGTVSVQSGTLSINGGGVNSGGGTFATANGGRLALVGITFANNATISSSTVVDLGGSTTVNGVLTASNLQLVNGTLEGTNVIVGTLTWSGGSLAGALTLASNSVMNIVAGGGDGFNGLVLTNYGTVNWTNATLYGVSGNNAQIYNYGLWNAQSDDTFQGGFNGGTSWFNNFGTFLKSGNSGGTIFDVNVVFNNTGIVRVQSGTLGLHGGGAGSDGNFTTASGGNINIYGYTFSNGTTFTGPGSYVAGGQANFAGTIAGTLNWDGGSLAGTLTLTSNSVMNIVAGGGGGFNGLVLTNYGTVNWTNAALYGVSDNNAQIYNYGMWNAQSDDSFTGGYNGGTSLFNNFGTFLKSGNGGATVLDSSVVFNNTGVVLVPTGTLGLHGGGTSSGGNFTTGSGANINLYGYTFTNVTTFTGSGSYVAGGQANFAGTIAGTLNWDGGSLAGTLTLTSNSVMNIVAGGGYGFNGLVLTNYGTVNWTNATLYGVSDNNAQIYNYGMWNAQSDDTFTGGYNGGTTLFDNFGTFLKSGHTGSSSLDGNVVFNNSGTVSVQGGTLNIGRGTSSGSRFTTANGEIINLSNYTFTNVTTFTGSGSYVAGGATFAGTIAGTLTWSGGSLAGALTLASNSVMNVVAGGGDGFNGLIFTNYGTVNWTEATLYGLNSKNAQIYNYGLWNAQSDNTFVGGYNGGTSLFDNFGTFLKSGHNGATVLDGQVVFNNTGTVSVQSGTLSINGGGVNSGGGTFATANGGQLDLVGITFANNATISSSGVVVLGGNTTINGVLTVANLQLVSGTLSGTNVIVGTLTWSGGNLAGALTLASNSVMNIVAGGGNGFLGLVLTNYGTVNWTNTAINSYGPNNAQIYNYGLWNAEADSNFAGGLGGGTTLFDNLGTFLKSGLSGTTTLDGNVVFNNTGVVDVESGTLSLNGSYSLDFDNVNLGISSPVNYGALSLAGDVALTGTVGVSFNNGFVPAAGTQFQILTCGSLSGRFNSAGLPVGASFVYASSGVTLVWSGITAASWATGPSVLHGTSTVTFLVSPGATVQLVASAGGVLQVLGTTTTSGLSTIVFDTMQLPNGPCTLRVIVRNAAGQVVGDFSRTAVVNNLLAWHEGTLSSSQTWGTNVVNAVDQDIIIPNGITLTLAPGAIVKFAKGTGIIVQSGGILEASGATAGAPIILTSLADDSAGGDSNADGNNSVPAPGDWNGVTASGQFNANAHVQIRYISQAQSGSLAGNQEWDGSVEHLVSGNLIIPKDVTLTIDPGAIVKFAAGGGITVNAGGTLSARGTFAQPITFTSIKDDTVGGDSNGDGNATRPAPGDWNSIYISGGTGLFDHVSVAYGASQNLPAGLITSTASGSVVRIANSVFSHGLYVGIQAGAGTVLVTNSVVSDCDRGVQSGLYGNALLTLVNCTLDANNIGLFLHGGTVNAANTIIADSFVAGVANCCGSTVASFRYCDVWSANGTYGSLIWPFANQTGQNGNISADPGFKNAAQGNYELNYGSPCIDAADGGAAPATDQAGAPRYNDPRTAVKTGIPDTNGLYADIGAFEFVETASSDVDLIVTEVVGPSAAVAGQTVTVQWNDVNVGSGSAAGPWHDTVSLVPQNGGDPLVVGTVLVAQNTALGRGQSYAASASVVVPGGQAGAYYWQVQVNSQGDVFEGVNWTNNFTLSPASSILADPTLAIGGAPLTNVFTAAGQSGVFAVVSAGGPFVVNVQGATPGCALELFVGDGYVPAPSHFDFKSSQFNSAAPSLTVPSSNHDTYYVVVYALSLAVSSEPYTIGAVVPVFALNSSSPDSIANQGPATIQVNGSLLEVGDTYQLAGPGGTFTTTAVQVPDPTTAYATFDLNGAATGSYTLQVTDPNGIQQSLPGAVNVLAAAAARLSVQLQLPAKYRVGRVFDGQVVYGNTGNVDMPAPLLILSTGGQAGLRLLPTDSFSSNDLQVIGASLEGPAGVLRPGQTWSIPFSALCLGNITVPISLDYKTADATDAVDYAGLSAVVRPPGYSDSDWNVLWTRFQSAAGPTWGGFVKLIDQYATIMAQEANLGEEVGTFYSFTDVLGYALGDSLEQVQTSVAGTLYLNDTNHPLARTFVYLANTNGVQGGADQSNPDGTFRILNLSNDTYNVTIAGYWLPQPLQVTMPASGSVTGVSVIARQGGRISGIVFDQTGNTLPTNVTVQAISEGTNGQFGVSPGADGSFVLAGLPPDVYDLTVAGGSFAPQTLAGLSLSDGQVVTTNFYLTLGTTVTGQVTGNGLALSNAVIFLTDSSSALTDGFTDANGNFAVTGLAAGAYSMSVTAPGFATYSSSLSLVDGGQTNLGVIALGAGATLTVSLHTAGHQPITNGVLGLSQNGVLLEELFIDTNGFASFADLAGGTYVVEGIAYGFDRLSNVVAVATGIPLTNDYILTTLGSIAGRVTDGGGQPIRDLDVNVDGTNNLGESIAFTVQTDSSGNYALLGLPAGIYLVTIGNNGGIDSRVATINGSLGQQTLNFSLPSSTISGLVLAASGDKPAPDATVSLTLSNQLVATATTDTNGFYLFRVLVPGNFTLAAGSADGISSNLTLNVPANTNLAVSPLTLGSVQLGGAVTDGSSQPLTNATLFLLPAGGLVAGQMFFAATSTNGGFAISGLVPGQYVAFIKQDGFVRLKDTINVPGSLYTNFVLTPGLSVTGLITDASSGLPVSNAVVSFFAPATHLLTAMAGTDASGVYTAADLAAANYDVIISEDSHQVRELPNVAVNMNASVWNATLAATNTLLHGLVTDTGSNPVANATVSLVDTNTGEMLALITTGDDGAWSTGQLPPGTYWASASSLGYLAPAPGLVTAIAGLSVPDNIVFVPAATDDNFINASLYGYTELLAEGLGKGINYLNDVPSPDCVYTPSTKPLKECIDCKGHHFYPALALQGPADNAARWAERACENWKDQYNAGWHQTGGSAGKATINAAKLAASLAGFAAYKAMGTYENVTDIKQIKLLAEAGQQGILALQATKDTADLIAMVQSVSGPVSKLIKSVQRGEGTEAIANLTALMTPGTALNGVTQVGNVAKTVALMDLLMTRAATFPVLNNVMKVLGPLKDALNLAIDTYKTYEDFTASAGPIEAARWGWISMKTRYDLAMDNFNRANVCPPMPPCNPPPKPPNPTHVTTSQVPPTQSQDPNDKLTTGLGTPAYIVLGTPISYTILFENQPTASAPAQTVSITDPLDANLDWSTLQLSAIGFNNVTIPVPSGAQTFSTNVTVATDPNPVRVTAALNPTNGVVAWTMTSINPATGQSVTDPLAGFLPPDTTNGVGEGYVTYTIQPRAGLTSGTIITNQASIVFDVNAPILTPVATNTIDITGPASAVNPLPAKSSTNVFVSWSGTDAGSGIAGYSIQVSSNGGPWTVWLDEVTNTSAVFPGTVGVTYSFASYGFDRLGNQEPAKAVPDASTKVVDLIPLTVTLSGWGTLANPNDLGVTLRLEGADYTLTAVPFSGFVFTNWTGSLTAATAALTFTMEPGLALQANFAPADTNRAPWLAITSHTNLQTVVGTNTVLAGIAYDAWHGNHGITNVSVNKLSATNDTAAGTNIAHWSKSVALASGTNLFTIVARDGDGYARTNVIRLIRDITPPTITQLTPKPNQYWSNAVLMVTGTAHDNVQVASVWYQLNSNGWLQASGTTNWTARLDLTVKTNTLWAYAMDTSGNKSVTNRGSFLYIVSDRLPLSVVGGKGTLSPNYSNAVLEIGKPYTITATPGTGFVFTNWTGGVPPASAVLTNGRALRFVMQSNLVLQANFVDVAAPLLSIISPVAGQRITNTGAPVVVKGKASDNLRVTNVLYQLGGGAWFPAATTNGWTNWTATLAPPAGTNTVKAYAVDAAGNKSSATNANFFFVVTNRLTLITNGIGSITRNFSGNTLEVGRGGYQVTALPGTGQMFSNWSGSMTASTNPLTFVMQSNMWLQANFVTNPFIATKGTYNGLFYDTNQTDGVALASAGFLTLDLSDRGTYSAKLYLAGMTYSWSGQFDVAGRASERTNAFTAVLALDLTPGADQLTGMVSNGLWSADLLADRAVFSQTNQAPYAGKYTLIVPGATNADGTVGLGNGYGAVNVATNGAVTTVGALADGTALAPLTAYVSKQGALPLYASLYSGKGFLLGWMLFDTNEPPYDLHGLFSWIKQAQPGVPYYPFGLTNELEAVGSRYTPPAATNRVINLTNGVVVFEGGNLSAPFTNLVMLTVSNKFVDLSPSNRLSMTLMVSNGVLSGSVKVPGTTRTNKFNGVLLQNQNIGAGYFLGTNQSGGVWLGPAQ